MHKEAEIEEDLHVGLVCGYAISAVKRELLHLKKIKELELESVAGGGACSRILPMSNAQR